MRTMILTAIMQANWERYNIKLRQWLAKKNWKKENISSSGCEIIIAGCYKILSPSGVSSEDMISLFTVKNHQILCLLLRWNHHDNDDDERDAFQSFAFEWRYWCVVQSFLSVNLHKFFHYTLLFTTSHTFFLCHDDEKEMGGATEFLII